MTNILLCWSKWHRYSSVCMPAYDAWRKRV